MSDGNLSGDDVKLVRYQIVSIERNRERILENDLALVTDDLTGEAFAAWVIARHFQGDHVPMPESRKKYLRVCYRVLCRWPKESLGYERRQLDRLAGIEGALQALSRRQSPGAVGVGGDRPSPAGSGDRSEGEAAPGARSGAATGRQGVATSERRRVLAALSGRGGRATVGQLNADLEGLEWSEVRTALHALVDEGRVEQTGHGATARYRLVGGGESGGGGR